MMTYEQTSMQHDAMWLAMTLNERNAACAAPMQVSQARRSVEGINPTKGKQEGHKDFEREYVPRGPGGKHENMEHWTPDEDNLLQRLNQEHPKQWKVISDKMVEVGHARTHASCRNRLLRREKGKVACKAGDTMQRCQRCGQPRRGHICTRPDAPRIRNRVAQEAARAATVATARAKSPAIDCVLSGTGTERRAADGDPASSTVEERCDDLAPEQEATAESSGDEEAQEAPIGVPQATAAPSLAVAPPEALAIPEAQDPVVARLSAVTTACPVVADLQEPEVTPPRSDASMWLTHAHLREATEAFEKASSEVERTALALRIALNAKKQLVTATTYADPLDEFVAYEDMARTLRTAAEERHAALTEHERCSMRRDQVKKALDAQEEKCRAVEKEAEAKRALLQLSCLR